MSDTPCKHGNRHFCGFCEAESAPKCEAHGNPWFCGLCGFTAAPDWPKMATLPEAELTRLRAIEGAARAFVDASWSTRPTNVRDQAEALHRASDDLTRALSGNAPPDPRDERIRVLEDALAWIDGEATMAEDADSLLDIAQRARTALTHRSDK